jgi:glycosyltransferase involved in cell wall biosynthesis
VSTDPTGSAINPIVSVLIPTYNRAALLGRAIRSVLGQCYRDFELFVIDDGSSDVTPIVVAGFGDQRVRYLPLPCNTGAGAARNAGIRAARGEVSGLSGFG